MDSLPDLPKKRNTREADLTPKVLKWFRENHVGSCAIEIKASAGTRIPASALAPHQRLALEAAAKQGIVHKIADNKAKNPFDAFMLKGVPAYVVACFTHHRVCLVIPVDKWSGATPDHKSSFVIDL